MKVEDRLELLFQKEHHRICENITGIFLWGVLFGALIAYMSVMPLILGIILGVYIDRRNPTILAFFINKITTCYVTGFNIFNKH